MPPPLLSEACGERGSSGGGVSDSHEQVQLGGIMVVLREAAAETGGDIQVSG